MTIMQPICAVDTIATLGALTINNVLMHKDGAWNVLNPHVLWLPNANRGSNVVISKARGQRPYPFRTDQSTYSMQIIIDGMKDWDGVDYDNPWEGLETNTEYLYDNVFIPPTAPLSTYQSELDMPSGAMREALVQPKYPNVPDNAEHVAFITTFPLVVPNGRFEPAAS